MYRLAFWRKKSENFFKSSFFFICFLLLFGCTKNTDHLEYHYLHDTWEFWSYFSLVLVILFIVMLLVLLGNRSLQIQVEERTKALRESNQQLQKNETFLRILIETIPDLVWLKDTEGFYILCNSKFERFFGAKIESIVGKTDHDFVNKELADFFRRKDKAAMLAGKSKINEEEITYADDGHVEKLETIKTPMKDVRGNVIGVLGVARDITERKRAEIELRELRNYLSSIINSMPSIIVGVDIEGNVTQWNSRATQVTGVEAENAKGELLGKLIPRMANYMPRVYESIQKRESVSYSRLARKEKDGTYYENITIISASRNGRKRRCDSYR